MLQQEESMLPNSAGVHEGNLRHNKSKYLLACLFHSRRGNVHLNRCAFQSRKARIFAGNFTRVN